MHVSFSSWGQNRVGNQPLRFGRKEKATVAILGGGVAGVTAAYAIQNGVLPGNNKVVVLEANDTLGGNAASFTLRNGTPVINGASVCAVPTVAQERIFKECGIQKVRIQRDMIYLENPDTGKPEWVSVDPDNKTQSAFGKRVAKDVDTVIRQFKRDIGMRPGVSIYPLEEAPESGFWLDEMNAKQYIKATVYKRLKLSEPDAVYKLLETNLHSDIGEELHKISAYTAVEDQITDQTEDRYLCPGGNHHIVKQMAKRIKQFPTDDPNKIRFRVNCEVQSVRELPDKVEITYLNKETGKTQILEADRAILALPLQRLPKILGLTDGQDYFPPGQKVLPDSAVDLFNDIQRGAYAMINFFVDDKVLPKDNTYFKFPDSVWLKDVVQYGASPVKNDGRRPSVLTCYVPIPRKLMKDLPMKGKQVDQQALIARVSQELANAVPNFEQHAGLYKPTMKYYPEAMAALKKGQVRKLREFNKHLGRRLSIAYSEMGGFPSVKTAMNEPINVLKAIGKNLRKNLRKAIASLLSKRRPPQQTDNVHADANHGIQLSA